VVITVTCGTLAAYAAARLQFFGKRTINMAMVLVYLFPAIVMAIPLFVIFSAVGLRDSLVGLTIVYLAQTIPVALYMLRSYFVTVPVDPAAGPAATGLQGNPQDSSHGRRRRHLAARYPDLLRGRALPRRGSHRRQRQGLGTAGPAGTAESGSAKCPVHRRCAANGLQ
jgi:hypothetical protein